MKSRRPIVAGMAILLLGVFALIWNSRREASPGEAEQPTEAVSAGASGSPSENSSSELPKLWPVPSFSFRDQDEKPMTEKDLRGRVWIANFIFTQCTTACPTMTAKMILLQREVTHPQIRFVSFSVDPEHDSPAALKAYAASWAGDESRWRLLSTDPAGLAKTATGMKIGVFRDDDPDRTIIHSVLFLLVDEAGFVRGTYNSNDVVSMKKLAADSLRLAGANAPAHASPQPSISRVESGEALYRALGCGACHNQAKLAPPLAGLAGQMVRFNDGTTLTVDDAYLRESIEDPGAKIVASYSRTMPHYKGYLTGKQTDDLVEYIKSLKLTGSTTRPTEQRKLAVDPVCEMDVSVDAETPHAAVRGVDYYFCCESCRVKFNKNPGEYLNSSQTQPAATQGSKPEPRAHGMD